MDRHRILRAIGALWLVCAVAACAPKVQLEAKDPIVINMNIKIEHEIRVKVDKELDELFDEESGLY
jgi:hypothetical protein